MQAKKRAKSVSFGKKAASNAVGKEVNKEATSNVADVKNREYDKKVSDKVVEEILSKAAASNETSNSEKASPEEISEPKVVEPEAPKEPKQTIPADKPVESKDTEVISLSEPSSLEESLKSLHSEPEKEEQKVPEELKVEEQKEQVQSISSQQKDFSDQKTESVDESKISDVPGSSFFTEAPKRKNSGKRGGNLLFFLAVAFVSFILGLGVMWGVSYGMKNPPSFNFKMDWFASSKPTPTTAPEPTAEPTEESVDLSAHEIKVLNGSGITGKAASLKASLEEAGFTVSSTGNADLDDYTKTEIRAKKTVSEAFLKKLETELKKDYVLNAKPGLSPTGADDVIVVIGSETAK